MIRQRRFPLLIRSVRLANITSFHWSTNFIRHAMPMKSSHAHDGACAFFKYWFANRWWDNFAMSDSLSMQCLQIDPFHYNIGPLIWPSRNSLSHLYDRSHLLQSDSCGLRIWPIFSFGCFAWHSRFISSFHKRLYLDRYAGRKVRSKRSKCNWKGAKKILFRHLHLQWRISPFS